MMVHNIYVCITAARVCRYISITDKQLAARIVAIIKLSIARNIAFEYVKTSERCSTAHESF
jgi:hypothetical protein